MRKRELGLGPKSMECCCKSKSLGDPQQHCKDPAAKTQNLCQWPSHSLGRTWSDLAQQPQACFSTALNLVKALASV